MERNRGFARVVYSAGNISIQNMRNNVQICPFYFRVNFGKQFDESYICLHFPLGNVDETNKLATSSFSSLRIEITVCD